MIVSELMEALKVYPPEMEVLWFACEDGFRELPEPRVCWFGEVFNYYNPIYVQLEDCDVEDYNLNPDLLPYQFLGKPFLALSLGLT